MDFVEHIAKSHLQNHGISIPFGQVLNATSFSESDPSCITITGPVAVKAQVPAGGRGKAGGVVLTKDAVGAVKQLLGTELGQHRVNEVLVEQQVDIATELYLAVTTDGSLGCPVLMFSAAGGIDVESESNRIYQLPLAIDCHPTREDLTDFLNHAACPNPVDVVADVANKLYAAYLDADAELLEINPLAITRRGDVVALDAKLVVDDSALDRQPVLTSLATQMPMSELETKAVEHSLRFIELGGDVGVLANGAGLTMTTMDAIVHHGGTPANFLEIGGDSYTLAVPALELVLANPNVKSLVVNFCGAFARCDVMTGGVVEAWKALQPTIPVFFSIHGTGMDEARAMVRSELELEPFESMDDAISSAVSAAAAGRNNQQPPTQPDETATSDH